MHDPRDLKIVWTKHALQRAEQRFKGKSTIWVPKTVLRIIAARKAGGDYFRVRAMDTIFICVRSGPAVTIVTVINANDPDTRRKKKSKRRKRQP